MLVFNRGLGYRTASPTQPPFCAGLATFDPRERRPTHCDPGQGPLPLDRVAEGTEWGGPRSTPVPRDWREGL